MGLIREKVKIRPSIDKEWIEVSALVDTGASTTILKSDIAKSMGLNIFPTDKINVEIGDSSRKVLKSDSEGVGLVQLEIQNEKVTLGIVAKSDIPEEMIIGANLLQECDAKIDMENDKLIMGKCKPKIMRLVSLRMVGKNA